MNLIPLSWRRALASRIRDRAKGALRRYTSTMARLGQLPSDTCNAVCRFAGKVGGCKAGCDDDEAESCSAGAGDWCYCTCHPANADELHAHRGGLPSDVGEDLELECGTCGMHPLRCNNAQVGEPCPNHNEALECTRSYCEGVLRRRIADWRSGCGHVPRPGICPDCATIRAGV